VEEDAKKRHQTTVGDDQLVTPKRQKIETEAKARKNELHSKLLYTVASWDRHVVEVNNLLHAVEDFFNPDSFSNLDGNVEVPSDTELIREEISRARLSRQHAMAERNRTSEDVLESILSEQDWLQSMDNLTTDNWEPSIGLPETWNYQQMEDLVGPDTMELFNVEIGRIFLMLCCMDETIFNELLKASKKTEDKLCPVVCRTFAHTASKILARDPSAHVRLGSLVDSLIFARIRAGQEEISDAIRGRKSPLLAVAAYIILRKMQKYRMGQTGGSANVIGNAQTSGGNQVSC
jgi:hypothetical protein